MDEIVAIIDKSGSMRGYEKATVSGFNEFIQKQRDISDDAVVTLIFFNHKAEQVYSRIPISEVDDLDIREYRTGGSTALNDTIGYAVTETFNFHELMIEKPKSTIFAIFTDGYENDSTKYTSKDIKTMITQREKGDWEFIYVGCDHDVRETAQNLGVKSSNTIAFNKRDLLSADTNTIGFAYSSAVASYRTPKNETSENKS